MESKTLYEILVPCNWNNGKPVRTRHHREWDKRVRKISGGLTILKPGKGQWIHDGELFVDRVIPVRILCTREDIDKIADITIAHYEQEAVLFYPVTEWCIVKHATQGQRDKFDQKRNTIASDVANAFRG